MFPEPLLDLRTQHDGIDVATKLSTNAKPPCSEGVDRQH